MSNEVIIEFKVEQTAAIANIGKVQDALVYLQQSVTLTATSMQELSTAEQELTSQTEALEKAWGLSDDAMLELQSGTESMIDAINRNSDAFANNETKSALMKQSLQEQMDKYTQFGEEVPKELQAVADEYGVLSTKAEKATEKMKDGIVKVSGTFSTFFGNLKGFGEMTGIGGEIFGAFESGAKTIGDSATKAFEMGQNFDEVGKIVGPVVNNMKTSFTGAFSSISSAGGGFFKSFKGGLSGIGSSMKSALKGGMASMKGAWKGMSTGMKFSVGLVGAELVGKGIAALADAYSAACDRAIAKIIEQAKVEKKAFDDIKLIRDHADADIKKRMLTMKAEARARGEDWGTAAVKIQKAMEGEIKALKKRRAEEAKHKQELNEMTKTLNIMTDGAMKNLNHESEIMVEAIRNGTQAWGENRTMTDAAKAALQAQMDKYVAMGQEIPGNLQAIAKEHGVLTTKQQEWKDKSDAVKESLGLLTREGAKALREETGMLVQNIERNKTAFENNSVAAATMRDRIQEQLDKYEGMNNVPEKLQALADKYGVVSSKQEALLSSLGILTDSGMKSLNDETANLVDTIGKNADAFEKNKEKAALMKDEVQKQLDKYKEMGEKPPKALQDVADKYKVVDTATQDVKAAADEYANSLGFVKKEDVTAELDKMTKALTDNAEQYKNNPDMIQGMLTKMEELEKQAKQAGITLPDSYKKQKDGLLNVKDAADKLAEADKKLQDENKRLKDILKLTDDEINALNGDQRKAKLEAADLKEKTDKLTGAQKLLGDMFGMSDEQMVKFYETTGKIGGALTDVSTHGKEVLGFLESTGIVSGETAEALGGLLDGVGSIGAGFTELATNPIGGAMKILGGVVKAVTSIFKLFAGDGVGEAIDREREMIDISEEMEEKIRDLEDALGDTHAATSMLMGEIIAEAEINEENFANYAQRTRDILCDLDSGALSIGETQEAIGSAFNELISDAQRLGTEGSKEMIDMLRDVRGRGLEVAEMQDYVNEKLDSGVAALQSYLGTFADSGAIQEQIAALNAELASGTLTAEEAMAKQEELTLKQQELATSTADVTANWDFMQVAAMSTFHALEAQGHSFVEIVAMMQDQLSGIGQMAEDNGLQISEGLAAMTNLSTFVSQNEELATRIDSTRIMMESLGDAAFLSANDFTMFAEQTALQFDQVMTKTTDQEMALRLISPALEDLIKYSESYGYQIDENTQALIDQAREEGVLAKEKHSDQEITNRLLLSIAEAWGAHIPAGLKKFRDEFDASMADIQGQTNQFQGSLSDVEGQISGNLSTAVRDFDDTYTNAMTGSSVVTETNKWSASLSGVEGQLKHDLVGGLSQVKREAEGTFSKTQGNVNIVAKTIEELRNKFQTQLPVALTAMESSAVASFDSVQRQTGAWSHSLESVKTQITGNLTKAVKDFDKEYTDAMSGHSVITETRKWHTSLEDVDNKIKGDLVGTAHEMDEKFSHTLRNLKEKLKEAGAEGGATDQVFKELAAKMGKMESIKMNVAMEAESGGEESQGKMIKMIKELEKESENVDKIAGKMIKLKHAVEEVGEAGASEAFEQSGIAVMEYMEGLHREGDGMDMISHQLRDLGIAYQEMVATGDSESFEKSKEQLLGYFSQMQKEGANLSDIMNVMSESFDAVTGKTITEEMEESGFQLSETFHELVKLQENLGDNQQLVEGIDGLSGAITGMGESMNTMTDETIAEFEEKSLEAFENLKTANTDLEEVSLGTFDSLKDASTDFKDVSLDTFEDLKAANAEFEGVSVASFENLKGVGIDQQEALAELQPLLKKLEVYSKKYGVSLDETTTKLLAEAVKSGEVKEEQKTDTDLLVDSNKELADVMDEMAATSLEIGKNSPFSIMIKESEKLAVQIKRLIVDMKKMIQLQESTNPVGEGYTSAQRGFHGVLDRNRWFRLHKGERVDVWSPEETRKIQSAPIRPRHQPDTRGSARGGDIVFEHITIQSENGEEAVKDFMTAIKGNKYGVQNLIRKVAH